MFNSLPAPDPETVSLHDRVPGTDYLYEDVLEDPAARFEEALLDRLALEQLLSHLTPLQGRIVRRLYLGETPLSLEEQVEELRQIARDEHLAMLTPPRELAAALERLRALIGD